MHSLTLFSALVVLCASLSSCSLTRMINESTCAIHRNRQAVEMSTEAICRNIQAVAASNEAIDENRKKLDAINNSLKEIDVD